MSRFGTIRVLIGGAALGVGFLVYLLARPPEQTYFLYRIGMTPGVHHTLPPRIDLVSGSLPAFLHVFAFILITGGILTCQKSGSLIVACSWLITDWAFELGQRYPAWSEALVPRWFDALPVLENTRRFFRTGTYDPLDMIAVCLGALAAYSVLLATTERRTSS
jgi:hypothetical protein